MQLMLASGSSEAKRAIQQGSVKINGEKITDTDAKITVSDGMIVQVGKRKYAKVVFA
jgi:tyrosyl-tRNA synthetase